MPIFRAAKEGKHETLGFANSAYGMSKLGVTAITPLQQKTFDTDDRKDIVVNAVRREADFCKKL